MKQRLEDSRALYKRDRAVAGRKGQRELTREDSWLKGIISGERQTRTAKALVLAGIIAAHQDVARFTASEPEELTLLSPRGSHQPHQGAAVAHSPHCNTLDNTHHRRISEQEHVSHASVQARGCKRLATAFLITSSVCMLGQSRGCLPGQFWQAFWLGLMMYWPWLQLLQYQ